MQVTHDVVEKSIGESDKPMMQNSSVGSSLMLHSSLERMAVVPTK
jgi:hypothetical protein